MRVSPVLLVGFCSAAFVYGQANKAASAESVEATLIQIERAWSEASAKKDIGATERILADDWVGVNSRGKARTKAEALADLKSGVTTIQSFDLKDLKVRIFGSAAVVTGTDHEESTFRGATDNGVYLWIDVFVKRNGRWQAVASQSTRVHQP